MNSLPALAMVISGTSATGPTITMSAITTGCRAHGAGAEAGFLCTPPCGVGAAMDFFSMPAIGDQPSASMAGFSYGFGYFGVGFEGGRWDNGHFFYNRSVTNVNVTNIHNVYNTTVIHNTTVSRVSYNGGNGGITARPTPEEERAESERHIAPVAAQTQHEEVARLMIFSNGRR